MGLCLFPGSAIQALPSGMSSEWVRFNGNVLSIKNKMASLSLIFPVGAGYNAGGIGLSRKARKLTLWPKSVAFKRTRATGSHRSVAARCAQKSLGYVVAVVRCVGPKPTFQDKGADSAFPVSLADILPCANRFANPSELRQADQRAHAGDQTAKSRAPYLRYNLLVSKLCVSPLFFPLILSAQTQQAPVVSPEVHPDRSITFRLRAPAANEVKVSVN